MALAVTSKTLSGAHSSKNILQRAGKNVLGGQLWNKKKINRHPILEQLQIMGGKSGRVINQLIYYYCSKQLLPYL